MRKTSIADIAKKLNVSVATVSRALNNKDGVSEETRARVKEEVYNMKYLASTTARNLQGQVNRNVGIFVNYQEGPEEDSIMPDVLSKKMMGISKVAGEKGYTLSLFFENFQTDRNKIWELISQNDLCGIIALDAMNREVYKIISHYEIPFVSINWHHSDESIGFHAKSSCHVETDWRAAVDLFLKHLLDRGYKDIGIINWQDFATNSKLYSGMIQELFKQYHIKCDALWNTDTLQTKKQLYDFLDTHPKRAYISMFYKYGFWILDYCRERGLKIPEDVAVCIYDYIPMFDFMNSPSLTGVAQSTKKMGEKSMEVLIDIIEGKPFSANIKIAPIFIPGEST